MLLSLHFTPVCNAQSGRFHLEKQPLPMCTRRFADRLQLQLVNLYFKRIEAYNGAVKAMSIRLPFDAQRFDAD
jgi:hypothetical protein